MCRYFLCFLSFKLLHCVHVYSLDMVKLSVIVILFYIRAYQSLNTKVQYLTMFSECFWCWNVLKEVPEFQGSQPILKQTSRSKSKILSRKCKNQYPRFWIFLSIFGAELDFPSFMKLQFVESAFQGILNDLIPIPERKVMAEIRTLRGAGKIWTKITYFILFYFIFQCGAHKQKELKKI